MSISRRDFGSGMAAGALALAFGQARAKSLPPLPRIDVHMHVEPNAVDRLLALMDKWGIAGAVNLSGMSPGAPGFALEQQLEAAQRCKGRMLVFSTPNFMRALRTRPRDYGEVLAAELATAHQLGARGFKMHKGLGLGFPTPDGRAFLAVDDAGLDPLFEKAGDLGMPVAIHSGDPKAFWRPADAKNERWDELKAHPDWSFHGVSQAGIPWPSWQSIHRAFERRVARHPRTTFIGVHFGNDPEDPDQVARALDRLPNLLVDTAARVPEIGRQSAEKMHRFFGKYQDRILFGTDTGVSAERDGMMYGSNGPTPPTLADEERFFRATYRYFETRDRQFESPTPIQGRWKIDGIGLDPGVLKKIYFDNAAKLLNWRPGQA